MCVWGGGDKGVRRREVKRKEELRRMRKVGVEEEKRREGRA